MITAIVLAAGESKRMGRPKMLMPWGHTTVFGKVIETLKDAGLENIVVITGALHEKIVSESDQNISYVKNKDFSNGEMLVSVKVGLNYIKKLLGAALIVLGDQPQIQVETVKKILERYQLTQHSIIVPSYKMHRGHPWLVDQTYWSEINQLNPPNTLRDFLNSHANDIDYVLFDSPTILEDIDTQNDYLQYKP